MKVQNPISTKFMITRLKIDAFNIFMIFSSVLPKNLWIDFFVEQPVDKPL